MFDGFAAEVRGTVDKLAECIRGTRQEVQNAQLDESNDPGTVDLFSKVVQIHEKHEWFLREILKKRAV